MRRNNRRVTWLLCCAGVLTQFGCSARSPKWHPPRDVTADCPAPLMQYCVTDNYGKRCGCTHRDRVEAVLRGRGVSESLRP